MYGLCHLEMLRIIKYLLDRLCAGVGEDHFLRLNCLLLFRRWASQLYLYQVSSMHTCFILFSKSGCKHYDFILIIFFSIITRSQVIVFSIMKTARRKTKPLCHIIDIEVSQNIYLAEPTFYLI